jgi:hypothetical protein
MSAQVSRSAVGQTTSNIQAAVEAEAFVDQWIALFNAASWPALNALEGEKAGQDYSYRESQFDQGFRAVSAVIKDFKYPKWSIFNTNYLTPTPLFWVDIQLQHTDGRTRELWLALAAADQGFQTCSYAEKALKKRSELALQKEASTVLKFFAGTASALRKSNLPLIKRLEVEFTPGEGELRINLNVNSFEPGAELSHFAFKVLLRKSWLEFFESGETLIGLDGKLVQFADRSDLAKHEQRLAKAIGEFLTSLWTQFLADADVSGWNLDPKAEFSVQDSDGYYSFPNYHQRQQKGRFFA